VKNNKSSFKVPVNPRRAVAKHRRGKGTLAMGLVTEKEWCQSKDPLFKVKGMERYNRTK